MKLPIVFFGSLNELMIIIPLSMESGARLARAVSELVNTCARKTISRDSQSLSGTDLEAGQESRIRVRMPKPVLNHVLNLF